MVGNSYLVLFNASQGAYALQATCRQKVESENFTVWEYGLEDANAIARAVRQDPKITFAFALKDNQAILVVRFSTMGVEAAQQEMLRRLQRGGDGTSRVTRDERL